MKKDNRHQIIFHKTELCQGTIECVDQEYRWSPAPFYDFERQSSILTHFEDIKAMFSNVIVEAADT